MKNDSNFITMKVQVLIEDGCYHTSIRKVSRAALSLSNSTPESILMREAQAGAQYCFKQAYGEIMERSGLKPKEDVKAYIESEFSKIFPKLTANVLVLNDKIVIYGIRHADWFIDGEGVNPKYPEIEQEFGYTQFTHSYDYIGNGQFTHTRQGHTYYPCTALLVETPFTYQEIADFIDRMNQEGYLLELSKVHINSQEEYDRMVRHSQTKEDDIY